jgi:hypothetical protein
MTPTLVTLIADARGHKPGMGKLRRVVVRLDPADVARVDALRPRFKVPRAALMRAFCLLGLSAVEDEGGAP